MTDHGELPRQIIVTPTKSVGISIILTVVFGPLGMFYSTITGAIIMLIISGIVGFVTFGYGLIITHPICVIWGALATHSYNKKLLEGFRMSSGIYV
ncbi:MAG: hypothetical protein WB554_19095 [Desulfomonilaceae bacterium]